MITGPDETLAYQAAAGDRAALDLLMGRYHNKIHRACRQVIADPHDAEDAAQEARLAICRLVEQGVIDPTFVLTHRIRLADFPAAALAFADREPGFLKMLITP